MKQAISQEDKKNSSFYGAQVQKFKHSNKLLLLQWDD